MKSRLAGANRELGFDATLAGPNIWLMVGVNGAGKTTSLAKIAAQQIALGRSVLMAAGDTFRAAAGEQLETWATRTGAAIVRGAEGADPSSVVFDGVQSAAARGIDLVLADGTKIAAASLKGEADLFAILGGTYALRRLELKTLDVGALRG